MDCGAVILQYVLHGHFNRIAPTGLYPGAWIHAVEVLPAVGTIDAISIDILVCDVEVVLKIDTSQFSAQRIERSARINAHIPREFCLWAKKHRSWSKYQTRRHKGAWGNLFSQATKFVHQPLLYASSLSWHDNPK